MTDALRKPTVFTQLGEYWAAYGGARGLLRSIFFWFAVLITALLHPIWREASWWTLVLQTVPTLMGLSLAALTLFLGAGSEAFREIIAGRDGESDERSPFEETAAIFVHFLLVQFIALLLALLAWSFSSVPPPAFLSSVNEWGRPIFWCIGYFFFVYALTTVLAATFAVFEVVRWFDDYVTKKRFPGK